MGVLRIRQSGFNLRSKLNELDYDKIPYEKMPPGSIIQYVLAPASQVSTRFTTSSSTPSNTGIYIEISPRFATSYIYIEGVLANYHNNNGYCYNRLKNATSGGWVTDNGTANTWTYASGNNTGWYANPFQFRDAPGSTKKQTYQIWGYTGGSLAYWGWSTSPASGTRNFNNMYAFEVKQ